MSYADRLRALDAKTSFRGSPIEREVNAYRASVLSLIGGGIPGLWAESVVRPMKSNYKTGPANNAWFWFQRGAEATIKDGLMVGDGAN